MRKMLGIMGAMREETEALRGEMRDAVALSAGNLQFVRGSLAGRDIVLTQCGIGKVNAAMAATLMIERFGAEKLFFTGVAGAIDPVLDIGDIVIGTSLIEHDFDITAFGRAPGEIPGMETIGFPCDSGLVELADVQAKKLFQDIKAVRGVILSGDQFIASPEKIDWLKHTFGGICTEMEGAAVAHVCHLLRVPCLVLRAISDRADGNAKTDFGAFVRTSALRSKVLLTSLLQSL
ncbi:MAG: 5'-methylthioadenosine/adenosylhomocysteine nucleosidase [Fusobacteriaceae bacterium]|nr:5'-methylthioadenosine/adenosylhomocysteine nucleosidase [Fusobacteriaceae bacterium]